MGGEYETNQLKEGGANDHEVQEAPSPVFAAKVLLAAIGPQTHQKLHGEEHCIDWANDVKNIRGLGEARRNSQLCFCQQMIWSL